MPPKPDTYDSSCTISPGKAKHDGQVTNAQSRVQGTGGAFGGWCLYFKDGVPAYAHNWVGLETYIPDSQEHDPELVIRARYRRQ